MAGRPRSSALGFAICVVLAVLVLAACKRSSGGDTSATMAAPELSTIKRLVDPGMIVADDPRLDRGGYTFLADVAHPVFSSAKAFTAGLQCDPVNPDQPTAPRPCKAFVPNQLPDVPFAIVELAAEQPTKPVPTNARTDTTVLEHPPRSEVSQRPVDTAALAQPAHEEKRGVRTILLTRGGAPVDAGPLVTTQIFFARLYPAPPLAERTLTTEPFTVPRDALLRLSIGIEEMAWTIDSAPVYFRVVVEDAQGATQDLFRRILDPARHPDDRRWFDSDIDLSDLAGQTVRLRFLSEPAESGDTRPSLPLWGDPRVLAPAARRPRPSIVLVSLDTLRAKSMSTYGYALETSPRITALAAQGALFERAYTTFSNTLPSHMSMLTGLYPATHGVLNPPSVLSGQAVTLAEILRGAGYATAAFTEDALLDSRRGFRRGFSTYYENTEISSGAGDSAGTFGRALEWAGRNSDEGFFLFVHTYEVHAPYDPPPPYTMAFTEPAATVPGNLQRAYLQEIRYVDDVLQRLLDGLRKAVPEQDLLLIVTADHGEEFLEHGMLTHRQLFDEVMHIPLVMVWPGRVPAGMRVAVPVSLVDVTPTILALAGVPIPDAIEGRSLLPFLQPQPGDIGRDVVFGESPPIPEISERRFVARSANEKCMLTASGTGDVCFDLVRDPGELQPRGTQDKVAFAHVYDLGSAYRARSIAAQRQRDEKMQREHAERAAAEAAPPPGTPIESAGAAQPIESKLHALGYVE